MLVVGGLCAAITFEGFFGVHTDGVSLVGFVGELPVLGDDG